MGGGRHSTSGVVLYSYVAESMTDVPSRDCAYISHELCTATQTARTVKLIGKSKNATLARMVTMVEMLAARFIVMLSAQLMTSATTIPPSACEMIASQTTRLYPA